MQIGLDKNKTFDENRNKVGFKILIEKKRILKKLLC